MRDRDSCGGDCSRLVTCFFSRCSRVPGLVRQKRNVERSQKQRLQVRPLEETLPADGSGGELPGEDSPSDEAGDEDALALDVRLLRGGSLCLLAGSFWGGSVVRSTSCAEVCLYLRSKCRTAQSLGGRECSSTLGGHAPEIMCLEMLRLRAGSEI